MARALGSCALDGPLSEIERVRLEVHTSSCLECAAMVERMGGVTCLVRSVPAQQPAVAHSAPLQRRTRARLSSGARRRIVARSSLAVAGAAMAVWIGAVVSSPSTQPLPDRESFQVVRASAPDHEFALLRLMIGSTSARSPHPGPVTLAR